MVWCVPTLTLLQYSDISWQILTPAAAAEDGSPALRWYWSTLACDWSVLDHLMKHCALIGWTPAYMMLLMIATLTIITRLWYRDWWDRWTSWTSKPLPGEEQLWQGGRCQCIMNMSTQSTAICLLYWYWE